ncbi:Transcription factor [Stygiomarasmius scandens]|uniref:Transcription factor n=1 Tax=Marasmiellus scandens TaxID=2682957 RepID=A0ABR1J5U7_9AGAR
MSSTVTGTGSGSTTGNGSDVITATVAVVDETGEPGGKKKKTTKRRKVNHACLYCRRSHMTCDEGRPCQRCIKREIGHLCHDEQRSKSDKAPSQTQTQAQARTVSSTSNLATIAPATSPSAPASTTLPYLMQPAQTQPSFYYGAEFGSEFSVLSDFLETLDDATFFSAPPPTSSLNNPTVSPSLMFASYPGLGSSTPATTAPLLGTATSTGASSAGTSATTTATTATAGAGTTATTTHTHTPSSSEPDPSTPSSTQEHTTQEHLPPPLPAPTKTEKFLLTAADQDPGLSRDERLSRVIRSKYEAGLLKPYNYVKGYARLSRWMDGNVSQESKQQILQPLSVLRPKFRAIAQSLKDIDLVFIEEAFERLLLDYDRVFSAMGVPACLWRRTGEIYKGNREFSQLVGVDGYLMREGRLCIYELMAEESAVNYWEKYGNVAFDSSQKAVLTSCVLRFKPQLNLAPSTSTTNTNNAAAVAATTTAASTANGKSYPAPMMPPSSSSGAVVTTTGQGQGEGPSEAGLINCCFSFTIRRDKWGIPSMIVGNFIRC